MKACMHCISAFGIIHQGGRNVAECGPVESGIDDVMGLLVYMTRYDGLSACLPMVTVSFWCSGISTKTETTNLSALSARSLPLMYVCPLILRNTIGSSMLAPYCSMETMEIKRNLW